MKRIASLLITASVSLMISAQTADSNKLKKGEELFTRRCTGCHQLDQVRIGPALRNVFGRAAASAPGFPYSDALKASHLKWDEVTLDKWLTDTESLVPDNDMSFRVTSAEERGAIIAYLRSLTTK